MKSKSLIEKKNVFHKVSEKKKNVIKGKKSKSVLVDKRPIKPSMPKKAMDMDSLKNELVEVSNTNEVKKEDKKEMKIDLVKSQRKRKNVK